MRYNFKLNGRKLVNGDYKSPETTYAEFNDNLNTDDIEHIVNILKNGQKMLGIYSKYRDNMHIKNVATMLENFETKFCSQEYKR